MADWPEVEELAQVLNVENVEDWETTLDRTLSAAIARVKVDVGGWDEDEDEPDERLAQAALRMGELIASRPNGSAGSLTVLAADPTYRGLLKGHRRTFGVA